MIPIDKGLETAQIPTHPTPQGDNSIYLVLFNRVTTHTPQGAETTQKNAHLYGVRFFVWIIR